MNLVNGLVALPSVPLYHYRSFSLSRNKKILQSNSQNRNMVCFRMKYSLPSCLTLAINHTTNQIASRIVRLTYIYIYCTDPATDIYQGMPALGCHERTQHEECTCHKTFYFADAFRRLASSGHKGYTQLSYYSLSYLYLSKLVSFVCVHVTKLIA